MLQSGTDWTYTTRGQQATSTYTVAGLTGTRAFSFGYDAAGRNTSITYPNGETVGYSYDEAWHQYAMAYTLPGPVNGNYVFSATYTALDQPIQINLGSTAMQTYTYNNTMSRLTNTQVVGSGNTWLNKSYQYDAVGNVSQINNVTSSEIQNYTYDHRDRLASWNIGASTENYSYDVMGNITQRAALTYTYDYTRASGNQGGPYALRTYNGNTYTYDADGNMTADGTRTYNWSSENLPTSIVSGGVTESYSYDAEGERVKKVRGAVTTYYIGGLYEEQVTSLSTTYRYYYTFNGQTIAQREYVVNTGLNTLKYLHGDHLGSVSLVTNSTGGQAGVQEFDPWGKVRSGGTVGTQTVMNYTGQKLDGTGLLYYHARMYDPSVGRFVSPDSIVPGASSGVGGAGGSVGAEQNSKLTVDFHESAYGSAVAGEDAMVLQKGFWFQLTGRDKQVSLIWGPNNPQSLNRYSYVLNNPLRYIDPSGHFRVQGLGITFESDEDFQGSGTFRLAFDKDFLVWVFGLAAGSTPQSEIQEKIEERFLKLGIKIGGALRFAIGMLAGAIIGLFMAGLTLAVLTGNHVEIWYTHLLGLPFIPQFPFLFYGQGERAPAHWTDVIAAHINFPPPPPYDDYPCKSPAIPCGDYPGP